MSHTTPACKETDHWSGSHQPEAARCIREQHGTLQGAGCNRRQQEATEGNRRQQEATGGNMRQQVATGGNRWRQEATGGNRRQQEATGGNRRQQGATGGDRMRQDATGGNTASQTFDANHGNTTTHNNFTICTHVSSATHSTISVTHPRPIAHHDAASMGPQ